jgi:Flp pilus assembly pilin Flp
MPRARSFERGATAVEYALMAALIAVVVAGAVALLGQGVIALFQIPPGYF